MAQTAAQKRAAAQREEGQEPETTQERAEQEAQPVAPPQDSDEKAPEGADQSEDGTGAVNDGKDEPKSAEERTAQESTPVAPPKAAVLRSASGTDAIATDAAPLAGEVEESARRSSAPRALGLGDGDLNEIAVGVGLQSRTGERTGGIVDEDGNEVDVEAEGILDYGDGSTTVVTVRKRLYETFYLPGTQRPMSRLLLADGATLTREKAAALVAAAKA